MSLPLIDLRAKITPETHAVLEALHRTTDEDKSEIVRRELHLWAMRHINTANVLQNVMAREGIAGSVARESMPLYVAEPMAVTLH